MNISIHPANRQDVQRVAIDLRLPDVLELRLAGSTDPERAVWESFEASVWCGVARANGEPVVLFGVGQGRDAEIGVPWMLGTDGISAIRASFVLASIVQRDRMLKQFRVLQNMVHAGNEISIRWLRWLGFNIEEKPFGPGGHFFHFWMERDHV